MKIDKEIFDNNLLLTQAYCELQLLKPFKNNAEVLRTINPEYHKKEIFSFRKETSFLNNVYSTVWQIDPLVFTYLYDELFYNQLIYKSEKVKQLDKVFSGKILVANIDEVIPDGA